MRLGFSTCYLLILCQKHCGFTVTYWLGNPSAVYTQEGIINGLCYNYLKLKILEHGNTELLCLCCELNVEARLMMTMKPTINGLVTMCI